MEIISIDNRKKQKKWNLQIFMIIDTLKHILLLQWNVDRKEKRRERRTRMPKTCQHELRNQKPKRKKLKKNKLNPPAKTDHSFSVIIEDY